MQISDNVYYVGVNDRTKHRFEAQWLLPHGISYNSYLVVDEQVALIDTVEEDFFFEFLDKIKVVLGDRPIDYLIVNHMEPDHSSSIRLIRKYYPNIKIVGNAKTLSMLQGFYREHSDDDITVKEGAEISLGQNTLRFHLTPMLHWPETMVTYLVEQKTLFTGDAFGCFGALNGNIVDEDMDISTHLPEMERYYAAILGKYAQPVQMALKKLAKLDIDMICSTHGPIWKERIEEVMGIYHRLSAGETYEGVVIAYGSMYGNTQSMAEAVAEGVAAAGIRKIIVHNLSVTQPSYVLRDIFRYRGLAIGAPTYNTGIFPQVDDILKRLASRNVSHHDYAVFGGFSWASKAVKLMTEYNDTMKMNLVGDPLEWKQGANPQTREDAFALGKQLGEAVKAHFAQQD